MHYLRKCYGSLAVADHGIFVVPKLLGHSSIGLTASTYAGQVDELLAVKFWAITLRLSYPQKGYGWDAFHSDNVAITVQGFRAEGIGL